MRATGEITLKSGTISALMTFPKPTGQLLLAEFAAGSRRQGPGVRDRHQPFSAPLKIEAPPPGPRGDQRQRDLAQRLEDGRPFRRGGLYRVDGHRVDEVRADPQRQGQRGRRRNKIVHGTELTRLWVTKMP